MKNKGYVPFLLAFFFFYAGALFSQPLVSIVILSDVNRPYWDADIEYFRIFPDKFLIEAVDTDSEEGKEWLVKIHPSELPCVIIDKQIEDYPLFKEWESGGFLEKKASGHYVISGNFVAPTSFLSRPVKEGKIDIFLWSLSGGYAEFTREIIQAKKKNKNLDITFRFLKAGNIDWDIYREYILQKILQKHYPEQYLIYLWYRTQNEDPAFSDQALELSGAKKKDLDPLIKKEGFSLLEEDWKTMRELGISKPVVLWKNQHLVQLQDVTRIAGLEGVDTKKCFTCPSSSR
ncbi:MAG TPA: hypothetical protein VJC03_03280 [bacterium]|nr:hypothetical protein [bacterium]